MSGSFPRLRRNSVLTLLTAAIVALAASAYRPAVAEDRSGDAVTPVEDFSRQVEEFKKSYPELNKKIEESAKAIDGVADIDKARKEVEELRGAVSGMLGAVSDNGAVAQLGAKALAHARKKVREIEQGSRFKPEERDFLADQWRRLIVETERATTNLDNARKEFAELLRVLQTREDFIDELMQIRRASEALDVIRQLTQDIRNASGKLKKIIGGIEPPGV